MSETLKPCPVPWCEDTDIRLEDHPTMFRFICSHCGCRGPIRKSKAEAIAAWNQRPGDAVIEQAQKVADVALKLQEHGGSECDLLDACDVLRAVLLPPKEKNYVR